MCLYSSSLNAFVHISAIINLEQTEILLMLFRQCLMWDLCCNCVCVVLSVFQPDWTFVLGEQALDLCVPSFSHSSASIFVLGERNLYCLRDNGQIRFMKKLEFNPSCFLPYTSGKPGC